MKVQFEALVNVFSHDTIKEMPNTANHLYFNIDLIWKKGDVVTVEIVSPKEIYVTRNDSVSDRKRFWDLNAVLSLYLFRFYVSRVANGIEAKDLNAIEKTSIEIFNDWLKADYISNLQVLE